MGYNRTMRAISFSLVLVLAVSLQIVAGDTSSAFTQLMADMIKDEYDDDADANADRLQRRSDPSDFPMAQYKRQHDEFMHQQMAGQMARRSSFGQFYPEAITAYKRSYKV